MEILNLKNKKDLEFYLKTRIAQYKAKFNRNLEEELALFKAQNELEILKNG
jgi:hypothetical protein